MNGTYEVIAHVSRSVCRPLTAVQYISHSFLVTTFEAIRSSTMFLVNS